MKNASPLFIPQTPASTSSSTPTVPLRQIVLDTETTGLDPAKGHRIIEIGMVEIINRRVTGQHVHYYLNPDRDSDPESLAIHGLTTEFLADKPRFSDVAEELLAFLDGAEIIAHNAPFDIGFLDHELRLWNPQITSLNERYTVIDTLQKAKSLYPAQRNSLDALCKRLNIDNSARTYHGALLDAYLLTEVYLAMTGGQVTLSLNSVPAVHVQRVTTSRLPLPVWRATEEEIAAHLRYLETLDKASSGNCFWKKLDS